LGLATVQGIVGQSGGFINVYSEPGMGTTFKIYLPALHGELPEEEPPEEEAATGGSETVLVLEDQADVRDYAAASLRAYGYRVLTAGSAAEALWTSEREAGPIQLLLTDVVMPYASGRELAEQLRKLRPGIKVLYMSGYTENVIAHHGVLDRGTSFLQKPFSPETLARKVRAVLDAPKKAD
jgi:DNA-binding NtrC family response regulator